MEKVKPTGSNQYQKKEASNGTTLASFDISPDQSSKWLAENWSDVQSLHITLNHPTAIRAAHRKAGKIRRL